MHRAIYFIGAALLVALAAAALPRPAAADTTLTVGKASNDSDSIIPVNVGDELGFFKKRGIVLKIVDFEGGGKLIQAMTAGSIDIGIGAGTQLAFIAKGVPMMAVCESTTTLPYFSFGVPWDSPIKTMADLKGKKVGVSTAGSLNDWLAQEFERAEGWGPGGTTHVAIGSNFAAIVAAFHEHQIDTYIGGTTTFLGMEEKQIGRLLFPVSAYEGSVASGAIFASNTLIAGDPDAIRAFLAGWLETTAFIQTHKAEAVKLEAAVTRFSESVTSRDYDIVKDMYSKDCRFDAQALATLQRSFVELKTLDAPPDMSKLYTEAYLPK
ncbi:MAG TPA: ABC transporter substrate-binding protein [Stellaceae bacterium]|jgi:ABC-type nitrate/sulfonate/bicarbonate transport system substrate-binding protein|nr:ABC transporter substrate-binding protein [Stellaceae bacterium]